jgi:hypothetical protein
MYARVPNHQRNISLSTRYERALHDGGDPQMAAVDDVNELIERYHLALHELVNGNPEPIKEIFSHRDDVSLANPFGSAVRGWDRAAQCGHANLSGSMRNPKASGAV